MIGDTKSKPLRVIGAALRCKDLVRHRREIPQDLAYPSIGDPCQRPAAPIPQSRFLRDPLSYMDQVAALHDGADHKEMEEKSDRRGAGRRERKARSRPRCRAERDW